jgi:5-methylcytosine-specific restriction endonuclease McrA
VKLVPDEGVLRFAERVLSLIGTGRKSATYKLATLLALIDVVAESSDPVSGAPTVVSGTEVARRVLTLYWPQSAVYGEGPGRSPVPLRQSPQNDIPAKLHTWRRTHGLSSGASLAAAGAVDPIGWARLERELTTVVLRMPIPKLQRFGDSQSATEDRFIYDFGWRDEEPVSTVQRPDFDDRLHLRDGVGEYLVRLSPLLRPAIQTKWSELVARQNTGLLDAHQLSEFLFGATRVDLTPVRAALASLQGGACFFCGEMMHSAPQVDHFVPWSRHPDNTLDNLVAAHPKCNGAKSASIAGHDHLRAWIDRLTDPGLDDVAASVGWPRRQKRTVGTVAATYRWLPEGTRLWVRGGEFEVVKPQLVRSLLALAG